MRLILTTAFALVACAGCQSPERRDTTIRPYRPGLIERVLLPRRTDRLPPVRRPRHHIAIPSGKLESVTVTLSRSMCFGTCPAYTVELHGDGNVVYEGRCYTMVGGRRTAKVQPEVVADLVRQFRAADFWSLEPEYVAAATDAPIYTIKLAIGGRTKQVADYIGRAAGMPPEVTDLEAAIDRAAETARWVHGDSALLTQLAGAGFDFRSEEAGRMLSLAKARRHDQLAAELVALGAPVLPAPLRMGAC